MQNKKPNIQQKKLIFQNILFVQKLILLCITYITVLDTIILISKEYKYNISFYFMKMNFLLIF